MKTITFHCETITPMFLAGADGQTPELRAPSIKGAMRFWWRAMNGDKPLKQLKKEEAELFGGHYKDENGEEISLKSKMDIIVTPNTLNASKANLYGITYKVKGHQLDILDYLAYGTNSYDKKKKKITFDREYFIENQEFKIEINYRGRLNIAKDILYPFVFMERIGGLGAKTRNGFGKFHIKACYSNQSKIELPHITELLNSTAEPASFIRLSSSIKTFQLKKISNSAREVLSHLGLIYRSTRTNSEFEESHNYEKRSYLASPLQVNKKNLGLLNNRHSKSYFLSVIKSNSSYKGYIYFIPYEFLKGFDDISDKEYDKVVNHDHSDYNQSEEVYNEEYKLAHQSFNYLLENHPHLEKL